MSEGASADWQALLAAAVSRPGTPDPATLAGLVRASPARLAVYRNNALVPLVQALEETFPACRQLVGAGPWRTLLIDFVRRHPPRAPVLQDYGAELPDFLSETGAAKAHAALLDLVRLELRVVETWHAADGPLLDAADFARLLEHPDRLADLCFTVHPTATLMRSDHPVGSLWLAAHRAQSGPAACPAGPETVLLTRPGWQVEVRLLAPAEATLLAQLVAGRCLGEAMEAALASQPQAEPAALLATLVGSQLASGVLASARPV